MPYGRFLRPLYLNGWGVGWGGLTVTHTVRSPQREPQAQGDAGSRLPYTRPQSRKAKRTYTRQLSCSTALHRTKSRRQRDEPKPISDLDSEKLTIGRSGTHTSSGRPRAPARHSARAHKSEPSNEPALLLPARVARDLVRGVRALSMALSITDTAAAAAAAAAAAVAAAAVVTAARPEAVARVWHPL